VSDFDAVSLFNPPPPPTSADKNVASTPLVRTSAELEKIKMERLETENYYLDVIYYLCYL